MNPFHGSLDDNFRGRYVRAVSNDGTAYVGWVDRIHHHDRHVVLRDAQALDTGEEVGAALLAHVDTMEVLESSSTIDAIDLDAIHPAPYHVADFSREENVGYIADVRTTGFVGSYPVVRPIDDGYQIVEGHKRIWACRQAGLDEHPVEIVDVDDWQLACRFVDDHLPDEGQVHDGGTANGCYDDEAIVEVLELLAQRWGDRIYGVPRVAFNVDRLQADPVPAPDDVASAPDPEPDRGDFELEWNTPGPSAEDDGDDPGAEDDQEVPEEYECSHEDCDFSTDTENGLSIHKGRVHSGGTTDLDRQLEEILDEEGELPSKEIEFLLETSSDHYRNVLSRMQREGRVESRSDPDDGRRNLYRLATDGDLEDDDEVSEADTDASEPSEEPTPAIVRIDDEEAASAEFLDRVHEGVNPESIDGLEEELAEADTPVDEAIQEVEQTDAEPEEGAARSDGGTTAVPTDDDEPTDDPLPSPPEPDMDAAGDVWCGVCGAGTFEADGLREHHEAEHDGEPVALDHQPTVEQLLDMDAPVIPGEGAIEEYVLPDDVDLTDVEAACDDHLFIEEVAEALGLSVGRTRVVLVRTGNYDESIQEGRLVRSRRSE